MIGTVHVQYTHTHTHTSHTHTHTHITHTLSAMQLCRFDTLNAVVYICFNPRRACTERVTIIVLCVQGAHLLLAQLNNKLDIIYVHTGDLSVVLAPELI